MVAPVTKLFFAIKEPVMWQKNNVSFSRYLDLCVLVKPADFKISEVIICIAT